MPQKAKILLRRSVNLSFVVDWVETRRVIRAELGVVCMRKHKCHWFAELVGFGDLESEVDVGCL